MLVKDWYQKYREVYKFTCSHSGDFEDEHLCIFNFIEDLFKDMQKLEDSRMELARMVGIR